jgi:ferredoxin
MKQNLRLCIIGSGPTAAAVATFISNNNMFPYVFDSGIKVKKNSTNQLEYGYLKKWFDSSDMYIQPKISNLFFDKKVKVRPSFSQGGLSTVWGATFSSFRKFDNWNSIPSNDDNNFINKLVENSTNNLRIGEGVKSLKADSRSEKLLNNFLENKIENGYFVESATLAINSNKESEEKCIYCSKCLTGCPANSIWNSYKQIELLARNNKINYVCDRFVYSLSEQGGQVSIRSLDSHGKTFIDIFDKVILASGAIGTAQILINSGIRNQLRIFDTPTAFSGILENPLRHNERKNETYSHSLSQFWFFSKSSNSMHQVYPPSNYNEIKIMNLLRIKKDPFKIVKSISNFIHPLVSYFKPDNTEYLDMKRQGSDIELSATTNRLLRKKFQNEILRLNRYLKAIDYRVPKISIRILPVGLGYHYGASLSEGFEVDSTGLLKGATNIHIVDSSVLQNLEVGPITQTVMANAVKLMRNLING